MNDELLAILAVCALFLGVIVVGAMWIDSASCSAKWKHSDFKTNWGPIQGCLIEVDAGKWIPEERYREIDQ